MAKLARTSLTPPTSSSPLRADAEAPTRTHQGGVGYVTDVKTELFTLAIANFVSEDTFYEDRMVRDERYRNLIAQATNEDPAWTAQLLVWLRSDANMRTASIVGAIEYGRELMAKWDRDGELALAEPYWPRPLLASVLQRAEEPGEALGYWLGRYGRPLPKWLKKALGDAASTLYTPYAAFKYDGQEQPVRFADVIEYSQVPGDRPIWKWLLDRRHGHDEGDYEMPMLAARQRLTEMPVPERRQLVNAIAADPGSEGAQLLHVAGMTWEALSGWLQGPMDAAAWTAMIPNMGYMALLRNLRNFDEAGVSDQVASQVIARLTDPERVARSRQLPFRFYSAYQAAPSDRWKHPLGLALDLSLPNIPDLAGGSLILLDTSGSMTWKVSTKSSVPRWRQAALFGLALAKAQGGRADVFGFDYAATAYRLTPGRSTLGELEAFGHTVGGGGTYTAKAIRESFDANRHARVVVLTDEQAAQDGLGVFSSVPMTVPCYTFNVVGYGISHAPTTGTRHLLGAVGDATFKMLKLIEDRSLRGRWPWEI
jgi:hypothetical protein